jgi:ABC-type transport system involved in multi-copper enzyme maturation permease subunit
MSKMSELMGYELNTAYALFLLPIMIVAIPAGFAGKIMSSEFKNRTAFVNFPLPMSRITFYMGKFLAALTMSLTVMLLAVGGAILSCNAKFGAAFPNDVVSMLVVCVTGMIALLAMVYFLSTIFKKGAGTIAISLTVVLPFIFLMVFNADSIAWKAIGITPFFSSFQSFWLIDHGFLSGIMDFLLSNSYSALQFAAVSIAWGFVFLVLGAYVTKNKEV